MLQFKHENHIDDINTYKMAIKRIEKRLQEKDMYPDAVWELGTLLEILCLHSISIDHEEVFISCVNKITPDEYEEIFNVVYDVYGDYDYTFDEHTSDNTRIKFIHHNPVKLPLYATISVSNCGYKPTGKMIPEMKSDCSVIQG